jgi:hypothetical protein
MIGTIITGTFNGFTNLESIEFKLPMVCLVTGCVSRRRDARQITSIPACRDAPCNETKGRYFEFKRQKICEYIKISICFYFSFITYLSQTLLTY